MAGYAMGMRVAPTLVLSAALGHGAPGKALESLLLRTSLPLVGFCLSYFASAMAGASMDTRLRDGELTALPGAALAATIDSALLGFDRWSADAPVPKQAGVSFAGRF